jgi:hypothetical protein
MMRRALKRWQTKGWKDERRSQWSQAYLASAESSERNPNFLTGIGSNSRKIERGCERSLGLLGLLPPNFSTTLQDKPGRAPA